MNLPDLQNSNIRSHLNKAEIILETAQQIMKDFGMFGVEITFSGNTDTAYDELHGQLVFQVEKLLTNKAELLMSVLYQVDISDREIAKAAQELPHYNHVEIVAPSDYFPRSEKSIVPPLLPEYTTIIPCMTSPENAFPEETLKHFITRQLQHNSGKKYFLFGRRKPA